MNFIRIFFPDKIFTSCLLIFFLLNTILSDLEFKSSICYVKKIILRDAVNICVGHSEQIAKNVRVLTLR